MEILSERKRDSAVKGIAAEMLVLHEPTNLLAGLAAGFFFFSVLFAKKTAGGQFHAPLQEDG